MESGEILVIQATDGQAPRDFVDYCAETGNELLSSTEEGDTYIITIQKA